MTHMEQSRILRILAYTGKAKHLVIEPIEVTDLGPFDVFHRVDHGKKLSLDLADGLCWNPGWNSPVGGCAPGCEDDAWGGCGSDLC